MIIGIDAHHAEKDGSGNCTYTRGLLLALKQIDRKNDYYLYVTNKKHPFFKNFEGIHNFHIKSLNLKNPIFRIPILLSLRSFLDGLDVLHVQYIAPPIHKGKLVLSIHDLAFFHYTETFSPFERFRSKLLIPWNAKKAQKIITCSEYSKNDIIRLCGVSPEKVEVIYYGAPSFDLTRRIDRKDLKRWGIEGRYIFSLSRLNARKNLNFLTQAFDRIKERGYKDLKLVIGGKKDVLFDKIEKTLENSPYKNDIILTGFIPDEDLPIFYSTAEVFVYPSLFEGFGFPPLEAMAFGCPVITSNVTSLPEITGNAALLIEPTSVTAMEKAILEIIENRKFREELIQKGKERVKLFNWKETARKTLEGYKDTKRKAKEA